MEHVCKTMTPQSGGEEDKIGLKIDLDGDHLFPNESGTLIHTTDNGLLRIQFMMHG